MLYIIAAFVFLVLGIVFLLKPDLVWHITEEWKSYSSGDPSNLYLLSVRIGGVFLLIIAVAAAIIPFLPD